MKHFTLLLAMLATTTAVSAQGRLTHKKSLTARTDMKAILTDATPRQTQLRKAAATPKWMGTTEEIYSYQDGEWVKIFTGTNTYDSDGNLVRLDEVDADGAVTRADYQYTGNTQTIITSTSEDGETFTPSEKSVKTYDTVLPSLVVKSNSYAWDETSSDWVAYGNNYQRNITRDADGNMTRCAVATLYMGEMEEIERYSTTFDADTKKATSYMAEELGYNDDGTELVWKTSVQMENMTWKETNGQLAGAYSDFRTYGNYLASADVLEADGDNVIRSSVAITYGADNDNYTEVYHSGDGLYYFIATQTTDADKGETVYEYKYYEDMDADGVFADTEMTDYTKEVSQKDGQGNTTLYEVYGLNEEGDGVMQMEGEKYEIVYDTENYGGAATSITLYEYDAETGEYAPSVRMVLSNFVDVTNAIRNISVAGSTATTYYDLTGKQLPAQLSHGVTIIKQGDKVMKVVR